MKTAIKVVIAILLLIETSACRRDQQCHARIRGNYNYTEKFLSQNYFDKVKVYETVNLHFSIGNEHSVKIKAESNIIDHLEISNVAGLLSVKPRDGMCLNAHSIDIYITAPHIHGIQNEGTTKMDGSLSSDNLNLIVNGTMNMELSGNVDRLSMVTNGTCNFDLYDLNCKNAYIKCNGTARGKIFCSDHLNVDINGSANIKYRGYPQVSQTINGSGKVENDN